MSNHDDDADELEEPAGVHAVDPHIWTPARVGAALTKALRLAGSMVGPVGPGFVSATDVFPFDVSPDDGRFRNRIGLSPRQVSQVEAAWGWQARYLTDLPGPNGVLKVWLRCRALRRPFEKECRARGWSRSTAYLARDRALGTIAAGLNRDCVEVWG